MGLFTGNLFLAVSNRHTTRALLDEARSLRYQLSDFWFNHFNVSHNKIGSKLLYQYLPVIENHMMGSFHTLLSATAHSPQMLLYLENYNSGAKREALINQAEAEANRQCPTGMANRRACIRRVTTHIIQAHLHEITVNENYARELIELHTFGQGPGVEYFQHAVEASAQILSGWSINWGVHDSFRFRPKAHIEGDKSLFVNPHIYIRSGGQEEGETLLRHLAHHPATARNISNKLVRRFVSENLVAMEPLIRRMTRTFLSTGGDLPSLYRVLFSSREFWSTDSYRSKAVRPFDRHVRMARSLGIKVDPAASNYSEQIDRLFRISAEIVRRSRMDGQPIFSCEPPTGYPDDSSHWLSPGSAISSVISGFQAEDIGFNPESYLPVDSQFSLSDSVWLAFFKNHPHAPTLDKIRMDSVLSLLNERFDFELLTGEKATERNLYTLYPDRMLQGAEYQLLPVRTQMTLYFGSEKGSTY